MSNFTDLTLSTAGSGSTAAYTAVDQVNGKAFILYTPDYKSMSVVSLTPATPSETELHFGVISFTGAGGESICSSLGGSPPLPYVIGADGFIYAIGNQTFVDGVYGTTHRLWKIDPSTLVSTASAPYIDSGAPGGIATGVISGNTYVVVLNQITGNNLAAYVYNGANMTTVGASGGDAGAIVGKKVLGSTNTVFSEFAPTATFDNGGGIWFVSDDFGTTSYLTKIDTTGGTTGTTPPIFNTLNQFTDPIDVNGTADYSCLYDPGTNSLFVFASDFNIGSGVVGQIKKFSLASNTFVADVGAFPAAPVFDIQLTTPDTGIILGNIQGHNGRTIAGKFYLSDNASDIVSSQTSGDILNVWTAASLTSTQINTNTSPFFGAGSVTSWIGPGSGLSRSSNGFYNNAGTVKYMFVPRAFANHFYITPLSAAPPPPPSTAKPVLIIFD